MSHQLRYSTPTIESVLLAPDINGVITATENSPFTDETGVLEKLIGEYSLCLRQEDNLRAIEVLRKIISHAPSSEAYMRLGLRYWELNDLVRAAQALEKAVKLNPNNAKAQFHLGTVYITPFLTDDDPSKLKKAIRPVRLAIQAGAHVPEGHLYLGIVYTGLKNWGAAEEHFRKAIELDTRLSAAYMKLADLYVEIGDADEASRDHYYAQAAVTYEKLIEADPGNSDAYNLLGIRRADLGDDRAALKAYEKAVENGAVDLVTLASLGTGYLEAGRFQEAKRVLRRIIDTDPREIEAYINQKGRKRHDANFFLADAYTSYGVSCLETHRVQVGDGDKRAEESDSDLIREAEAALKKAIDLAPRHVNAHYDLAVLYYRQDRLDEAQETIRRLVEMYPGDKTVEMHVRSLLEEQLKEKLREDGLLKRIREPITDHGPYQNRQLITVPGKPVSETLVEDRR